MEKAMSVFDEKCVTCGKPVAWYDDEVGHGYGWCDDCVPRGCSCQMNKDGNPRLDSKGRELPCVDYTELYATLIVLHDVHHPENVGRKITGGELIDGIAEDVIDDSHPKATSLKVAGIPMPPDEAWHCELDEIEIIDDPNPDEKNKN